ncbi:MAG: efflux RND transporter permease subunit [Planctomycetota bacterium]
MTLEVGERDWWRHRAGQGGKAMIPVVLKGEDPEYLQILAADVEQRVRGLADVVEVWGPSVRGQKEARLLIDPDKVQSLGLTPMDVARTVGFAFRGQRLKRFHGARGEIEMLLGLPDEAQPGLAQLNDLPVPKDDGTTVPLGSLARTEIARIPPWIQRTDRATSAAVSVEFDDAAVTTEEGQARVRTAMQGLVLPEGYSWDFGEWGEERDETLATMLEGVLLSLLIVVLLMAALFESLTQPLAIVITLPLAFFGAFWSLWLGDFELDAVAFIGVIILIGIVVNNGIVLVDRVNSLRREEMERNEALLAGCGDRLRPVLMTAITTMFGLLPLAFSTFTVAGAYIDSLAVAVFGGLATSTFFTLIALPVWYTTVEDVGSVIARALPRSRRRVQLARARGGVLAGS